MIDLSICRNIRLGVSVLLAAVVLYGNLSCQHAVKKAGKRYPSSNFKESGKGAAGSSVIEGNPKDIDGTILAGNDVSKWNNEEISKCLTAERAWAVNGDVAVKQRLCKLICGYLIRLVECSGDGSFFKDPVLSVESLYEFLVEQGVKLKVGKVVGTDGSGSGTTEKGDGVTYVINDVVVEGGSSSHQQTDGDLLIGFNIDISAGSGLGKKYFVLYQMLRAMFSDPANRLTSDPEAVGEYFGILNENIRRLDLDLDCDVRQLWENAKCRSVFAYDSRVRKSLWWQFVSYVKADFLSGVMGFVRRCLYEFLADFIFDSSSNELNVSGGRGNGDDNGDNSWISGLFTGALVRMPFNPISDGLGYRIDKELDLRSIVEPCIFYIEEIDKIDKEVRFLGISKAREKGAWDKLHLGGYYCDQSKLTNDNFRVMDTDGCRVRMFDDTYDSSNDNSNEVTVDMARNLVSKYIGYAKGDFSVRSVPYHDCLACFYKDLLLVSLKKLEKLLSA